MSVVVLSESATPSTPASGLVKVFADTSGRLSTVDDAGNVRTLAVQPGAGAIHQSTPANPAGTAVATPGVMMGLAATLTPVVSGRVHITICGTIYNANAIGDGADARIRYGTGAAPANADAATGTTAGGLINYVASTVAGRVPFTLCAIVTGLSLATQIWIDVCLGRTTGGTAVIEDISIAAFEF